ncbi:hypothetical protein FA15DRAFT_498797 [Coprinopsis marcescibilis]|uniref:Uncharacterized protein n=1 Tax=Coprinopsis marcescibilis TaxID=230819 RepID=A0A5C3L3V2_COPMA|nr:hypothetical protein FA15DRAFT_498797 [Coprinopsis marcescibilis]
MSSSSVASIDQKACTLAVAQYAILGHHKRTEHWSILAVVSKTEAHVFQLKGNYDTFCYHHEIRTTYLGDHSLRGGFHAGTISYSQLGWLKTRLAEVPVIRHDASFDSQTWVMECIRTLKDHGGIILPEITERKVRAEMEEETERWEVADDIFFERLFNTSG